MSRERYCFRAAGIVEPMQLAQCKLEHPFLHCGLQQCFSEFRLRRQFWLGGVLVFARVRQELGPIGDTREEDDASPLSGVGVHDIVEPIARRRTKLQVAPDDLFGLVATRACLVFLTPPRLLFAAELTRFLRSGGTGRARLLGDDTSEVLAPLNLARLQQVWRVGDEETVVELQHTHEAKITRAQEGTG